MPEGDSNDFNVISIDQMQRCAIVLKPTLKLERREWTWLIVGLWDIGNQLRMLAPNGNSWW